jgi:predicted thioesterase
MKNIFEPGDTKTYEKLVKPEDTAIFEAGALHPVYATFALGRDAEWSTRLFVLDMKEDGEEGIGTSLSIVHHSPALVGETVIFDAKIKAINGHELICTYEARANGRLIATGETGQKILKKEKLEKIFEHLQSTI